MVQFDNDINAYIVLMPEYISLNSLHVWAEEFISLLREEKLPEEVALLIDSNKHKFESIECLKFLRDFLSEEPAITKNISRAAFVVPEEIRPAQIVSTQEAYFSNYDDAYQWLQERSV